MIRRSLQIALASVAVVALVLALPVAVPAQDGATTIKTEAALAPPVGAADPRPKGKAKTLYRDNGQNLLQKLSITAQRLQKRTDYRVVIDGVVLGVFAPKGNSGTLKLRYRTPAKGNQDAIPAALGIASDFVLIDVFDDATGELVLTGTFVLVDGDE